MPRKYKLVKEYLVQFLKEETFKTGLNGGVLVLDATVESFVVAMLAKEAFGNRLLTLLGENTLRTDETVSEKVKNFCLEKDIRFQSLQSSTVAKAYTKFSVQDDKRREAFLSRVAMAEVYDIAAGERALVLGSRNKSELLLGEGVLHGDLACAINPLGDLYATEVEEFAFYLGLSGFVEVFRPRATLREASAETARFSQDALDSALKGFTEERLSREELIEKGYDSEMVEMIIRRIYQNQYKHRPPVIAKLTSRTIGHDLQYPRDIKL